MPIRTPLDAVICWTAIAPRRPSKNREPAARA
jgi:hypothetical protein